MIRKILLTILLIVSVNAKAIDKVDKLNSMNIIQSTFKAMYHSPRGNCLNYEIPTHFCFWAVPHFPHPRIKITPVLDHYLPDLVVVVFRNNDENPWVDAKKVYDTFSAKAQEHFIPNVDGGNYSSSNLQEKNIIFKEAEVIGNPAIPFIANSHSFLLLESTATPYLPYFQSMLDSNAWRGLSPVSTAEELLAITQTIGDGIEGWGSLYPHQGTILQYNDARASMILGFRAADLLTTNYTFDHIHQSLPLKCGKKCQSQPITANSKETLFQMVYPLSKDTCQIIGTEKSYSENMLNEKGAYAWVVWRHYHGCADVKHGKYIGRT